MMPVNLILFIFSIIREKRIHRSIEQSEQIKLRYKIKKQICDEQKKVKDKNQKTLLSRQNTGRKENNRRNPPPPPSPTLWSSYTRKNNIHPHPSCTERLYNKYTSMGRFFTRNWPGIRFFYREVDLPPPREIWSCPMTWKPWFTNIKT